MEQVVAVRLERRAREPFISRDCLKMSRLREAVEIYLTEIGQQQAPELGGGSAKDKGLDLLRNRLLDEQRFNRRIFLPIVVLLTTLFAVGIYFVLKNRSQPLTAGAFLSFLSFWLFSGFARRSSTRSTRIYWYVRQMNLTP